MLSKPEIGKDALQVAVESAATRVGNIALIITGAVREVARELGELATDVFEVAENSRRAKAAREREDGLSDL
jgi:chemotaxis response regulator CheB